MRIAPIFLALALGLAGCLPATVGRLRATGVSHTFTRPEPCRVVYRRLRDGARECYGGNRFLASSGNLHSEFSGDEGEIVATVSRLGFVATLVHAEIQCSHDGTVVTAHMPNERIRRAAAKALEAWAAGQTEMTCR